MSASRLRLYSTETQVMWLDSPNHGDRLRVYEVQVLAATRHCHWQPVDNHGRPWCVSLSLS